MRGYLYILGSTLAKLSLLLFLYRIFRIDLTFRILSWILGAILTIWTTVSLLLCIFACRPIKASWVLSVQLDPRTKCPIKAYEVNNIHGICNIITDFALLIMPAPLVWKLNANAKKKLGLVVVFGTGILYASLLSVIEHPYLVLTQPAVSAPWQSCDRISTIIRTRTAMTTTWGGFVYGVSTAAPSSPASSPRISY